MENLVPQLQQIRISPTKIFLDPNNPRLMSRDEDQRGEGEAIDLMSETSSRMKNFKIDEIENSIKQNGWVPVDFIFVKKLDDEGRYIVLEGNRRVTAIRNLLTREDTTANIKDQLTEIDVMEIIDDIPPEDLKKKITYLLGVRHHGSLKKWSPFAQASNIYSRFKEISGQTVETFKWDDSLGHRVADALSINLNEVEERLKVFRVMEQVGNREIVKKSEVNGGGIKDRYYSVIAEVLNSSNASLRNYIYLDPKTFLLDEQSVERIINLCHFDIKGRDGAPIRVPQEWRALAHILADEDDDKRAEMLKRVEDGKEEPSKVWADRSVELQKLRWDKWLGKLDTVLSRVNLGDDIEGEEAESTIKRLQLLLEMLDEREQG